jgi:hydrogenase maturation protein HypF
MPKIQKARLHISGIVQGVGFRPFIYSLASRYELKGWVRNTSSGVDIEVDGILSILKDFIATIQTELPPLARIDSIDVSFDPPGRFSSFEILHSQTVKGAFQPISPDMGICADCLSELFDPTNRRYQYPFTNCTNCGPRYTIMTDIPYDRQNTTMAPFTMCPECDAEYHNPLDRRFHAQPVACSVCGPKVWLEWEGAKGLRILAGDQAMEKTRRFLAKGKILAIKGLGGFHLACDATDLQAVVELRKRKLRVDKPFALMMANLAVVEQHCYVNDDEHSLLESCQRPIVLLKRKLDSSIAPQVSPNQDTLGVMLPYTPLHYLLFSNTGHQPSPALVMTSGNISEEPIATENNEARQRLATLADAILMHDRDIRTRCDDSVVRVIGFGVNEKCFSAGSSITSRYFLRRSRGYAPDPINLPFRVMSLLAVGPQLKNTICLTRDRYAFISHHIGDMENYETLHSFEDSVVHLEDLFRIHPEGIVHDLHPDYLSTRYALARADHDKLPAVAVQHHHAHIASCMADNGLDRNTKVIGLAFDGTGYGMDGAIWGGEVLLADYKMFERKYHLEYFPLPGGDASIKRPARTALALLWSLGLEWDESLDCVQDFSEEERLTLHIHLERNIFSPATSSIGRLFDAAAALSGVRQKVNYEAQAAMEFESALDKAEFGAYQFEIRKSTINPKPVISALLVDVCSGVPIPVISARFHNGLANMARAICDALRTETGICEIALSGGVWQNMALLEKTVCGLREDGFTIYIHHNVPANDGGLSLGQALAGARQLDL